MREIYSKMNNRDLSEDDLLEIEEEIIRRYIENSKKRIEDEMYKRIEGNDYDMEYIVNTIKLSIGTNRSDIFKTGSLEK